MQTGTNDRTEPVHLTDRERQVLTLIAQGKTSKEIARALGIAFRTVICHRFRISKKIAARNAADFTRLAIRIGLVPVTWDGEPTQPGMERRREEANYLDRNPSETSGAKMPRLEWSDVMESLHQAKLRLDFAYNFLRELQADAVDGPDGDEALDTAVHAMTAALTEYASLQGRFITAVQRRGDANDEREGAAS